MIIPLLAMARLKASTPCPINTFIEYFSATKPIMKNGVFWDLTLCASCKNRCFGGT
jgi:hypothetical protein